MKSKEFLVFAGVFLLGLAASYFLFSYIGGNSAGEAIKSSPSIKSGSAAPVPASSSSASSDTSSKDAARPCVSDSICNNKLDSCRNSKRVSCTRNAAGCYVRRTVSSCDYGCLNDDRCNDAPPSSTGGSSSADTSSTSSPVPSSNSPLNVEAVNEKATEVQSNIGDSRACSSPEDRRYRYLDTRTGNVVRLQTPDTVIEICQSGKWRRGLNAPCDRELLCRIETVCDYGRCKLNEGGQCLGDDDCARGYHCSGISQGSGTCTRDESVGITPTEEVQSPPSCVSNPDCEGRINSCHQAPNGRQMVRRCEETVPGCFVVLESEYTPCRDGCLDGVCIASSGGGGGSGSPLEAGDVYSGPGPESLSGSGGSYSGPPPEGVPVVTAPPIPGPEIPREDEGMSLLLSQLEGAVNNEGLSRLQKISRIARLIKGYNPDARGVSR